ncbi:MAG: hypothetical protein FJW95_08165 [Actinobacteria bacterium]|nr:hypothetical protein [Actinomycetota bacterium]
MLHARREEWPDADAFLEAAYERGWTDGLPVVPATPERVEAFLATSGLAPDTVLGVVPTREVTVTAEHAAINSVMAGCRPEYFPVVVAAVRAHLDEHGNCHSTTGTLSGAAHAVIVNGPIRDELDVAYGAGCLGPGFRANATIGRALRLVIRNVCRAVPGFLDRATFSWPLRYSFCFGEDEAAGDWTPLHVQRGYAPDQSTVTVHSIMRMVSAWDSSSRDPEGVLDTLVAETRYHGIAGDAFLGDGVNVVYVMGREHQRFFFDAGWSKERMQAYLWPRLTAATAGFHDRRVNLGHPENILIVAAGGAGMAETWVLFPHLAWAVTRVVERPGDVPSETAR